MNQEVCRPASIRTLIEPSSSFPSGKWGFQTGILLNSNKLAYHSTLKDTLFCLAIGRSSLPLRKGTLRRHLTLQDGVGK